MGSAVRFYRRIADGTMKPDEFEKLTSQPRKMAKIDEAALKASRLCAALREKGVKITIVSSGAIGAGLAVINPLAAIFAFLDPGLAKNADCSGLTSTARGEGAPVKQKS